MVMKGLFILLAIQVITPAAVVSQNSADPPDLQAYLSEIRQSGISEVGKGALLMVAALRNGYTELFFQQAPDGSYGMGFTNLLCKNPNMDPDIARKEREVAEMKNGLEMVRLKPLVDADKSGFVTTAEAMQFRQLVEFGYRIAYLTAQEHNDLQATCKAMGMSEDAVRQKLVEYRGMQERVNELGLAPLPEVALK
jgi:hypothetical protein